MDHDGSDQEDVAPYGISGLDKKPASPTNVATLSHANHTTATRGYRLFNAYIDIIWD